MLSRSGVPAIEFTIEVLIEPDSDEFHAYCPALKGLHLSGNTKQAALESAVDAAAAYLESLIKNHEPIPLGIELARRRPPSGAKGASTTTHTERLAVAVLA